MLKKIIASLLLLLLIAVAIVQAMDKPEEKEDESLGGLKAGVKAPDFTLKTLDGEEVTLSDYRGKKVLLNFWATWCAPCKKEMPEMQAFAEKAGEEVVILAVNIDPENDVKAFADDNRLTFPIVLDEKSSKKLVNDQYKVLSIPTTFFIDRKGFIQKKVVSAMQLKDMEQYMNAIQ